MPSHAGRVSIRRNPTAQQKFRYAAFFAECGRGEKFFAPTAALAHLQFVTQLRYDGGYVPEIVGYMIRVGWEQLFSGFKSG